jgi:hypothetical protein
MKRALLRATVAVGTVLSAALGGLALAQAAPVERTSAGTIRDPLVPPHELYAAQNLPALRVTVIGYDRERPGRSMAVVRLDTRPPQRRVVYTGDRIGDYRIVRIEATRLIADAPLFGGTSRISLAAGDTTSSSH